jgi:myo-inositol 2-dehydrogenase / D-chiro-inositol 1-dehydrogenase
MRSFEPKSDEERLPVGVQDRLNASPLGVGLIGAGLVVQSIHVPVLAALADKFTFRSIWDIVPQRAELTAGRTGAKHAASIDALLADPAVDVVAICTPAHLHVEHALAAIHAGKRAVLVEKPLGTDLQAVVALHDAAAAAGTVLMVGSMHLHDAAWIAAARQRDATAFRPHLVRSQIILPPNGRFEQWSTEPLLPPNPPMGQMSVEQLMRLCIMELAIHDLPLVRRLLPAGAMPEVQSARLLDPFGYAVTLKAGGALVELIGIMHGHSQTDWRLDAISQDAHLQIAFTPSFVPAGSGTMNWTQSGATIHHHPADTNGYAGEWEAIAAILSGASPMPDPSGPFEDARFALAIAEQACAMIAGGSQS